MEKKLNFSSMAQTAIIPSPQQLWKGAKEPMELSNNMSIQGDEMVMKPTCHEQKIHYNSLIFQFPIYLEPGVDRYLIYWQLGAKGSKYIGNWKMRDCSWLVGI